MAGIRLRCYSVKDTTYGLEAIFPKSHNMPEEGKRQSNPILALTQRVA